MIALSSDYLFFQTAVGEQVPFCANMISVELMGAPAGSWDAEFVQQAANAVFYYFKHELGRKTVTLGEFAGALEKVLRGLSLTLPSPLTKPTGRGVRESDLCRLVGEKGAGCELLFFPRLRHELRAQLQRTPRVLRFRGLRGCVKQLIGSQRWTLRCRRLEEQIVAYLRECLDAEAMPTDFALVVD